ncbi:c-type cytochrome [Bacillus alkalicellulosilyticus]|uniref:c-type cytochrome n=1 Tax=Alkalihalobacterium alkalicellulosilyticum TaxID=1912214 RepID=UPI000995E2C8|nr:cytochrome c [Bacillus alkalicellulosilyticus]
MKKSLLAILAVLALVLGACGGGGGNEPAPAEPEPAEQPEDAAPTEETEPTANETENLEYDAVTAQEAYQASGCISCHGGDLQGVGSTPGLVGLDYSWEEILFIIDHGQGTMPKGLISGPEAENLAKWIADQQ